MRKLVIALIVLALLAGAADVFARRAAEDRIADRLQKTFELSSEPGVGVGGFPFLLNVVRGEIPSIEMSGDRVRSEDVTLQDVDVQIDDVTFSLSDVIDGSGQIRAAGGDGSAAVTEANLNAALETAGAPFTLSIGSGGITATSADGGASAEGEVALEGGALTVGAAGLGSVTLDLPSLGGRVSYEELDLEEGRAALGFTVQRLRISA
jgi:hypothetical protein